VTGTYISVPSGEVFLLLVLNSHLVKIVPGSSSCRSPGSGSGGGTFHQTYNHNADNNSRSSSRSPWLSLDLVEVDNLDITTLLQALEVTLQITTLDEDGRRASGEVNSVLLGTLGELLVEKTVESLGNGREGKGRDVVL
jgi:hypothetical protein